MAKCFGCGGQVVAGQGKLPVIWPAQNPAERRVAFCGQACLERITGVRLINDREEGGSYGDAG